MKIELDPYSYLSIISSLLVFIGYTIEIYFIYRNKESKINHLPMWVIWLLSSLFAISYCSVTEQYYSMMNYSLNFFFCLVTLLLKLYYVYSPVIPIQNLSNE